jgi:indoleamine 2,3-dioxygenase
MKQMRQFMPRPHRAFLEHIEDISCLRAFVLSCHKANAAAKDVQSQTSLSYSGVSDTETNEVDKLIAQYDVVLKNMVLFRASHMKIVAEYIIAQQKHGVPSKNTIGATAGGKGTGGTDLMKFLKPIREAIVDCVIVPDSAAAGRPAAMSDAEFDTENVRGR